MIGLIVVEFIFRVILATSIKGSLADLSTELPTDPAKEVKLGELLRADPHPEIFYRFKENSVVTYRGIPVAINSIGLRDDEVQSPKPPNTLRVLGLGDSTMWGWGVFGNEGYLEVLEDELQWMVGAQEQVEVVNAAVPGYMAVQEAATLELLGPRVEPDAVVIQYDQNDAQLASFLISEGKLVLPSVMFSRHLFVTWLPNLLRGQETTKYSLLLLSEAIEHDNRYAPLAGWGVLADSYQRIANYCRERNIPAWVVLPANIIDGSKAKLGRDKEYDRIRELCGEIGLPVIDTFPITQAWAVEHKLDSAALAVDAPWDWHANAKRHGLMARAILEEIGPQLLAGKLGEEAARQRSAAAGNIWLRQSSGSGFYGAERHGTNRCNWTGRRARMSIKPHGRTLRLTVLVGHPDVSTQNPLRVTYTLGGKCHEKLYETARDYSELFDVAEHGGNLVDLTIEVDRTFSTAHDPRTLGLLVYTPEFER